MELSAGQTLSHYRLLKKIGQVGTGEAYPNIATIYSVEHDQGIHFYTTELIEGRSLGELILQGGLPAGALGSDNVMITPAGRLEVLEFGLAGERRRRLACDPTARSS